MAGTPSLGLVLVGFFPVRAAFPVLQAGRHPYRHFEAWSSFTSVTACTVARPPYVGFIARLRPNQLNIEAFRNNIGRDYYTFSGGEMLGIVLDSNLIRNPEHVTEAANVQEEWLKKTLAEAKTNGGNTSLSFSTFLSSLRMRMKRMSI